MTNRWFPLITQNKINIYSKNSLSLSLLVSSGYNILTQPKFHSYFSLKKTFARGILWMSRFNRIRKKKWSRAVMEDRDEEDNELCEDNKIRRGENLLRSYRDGSEEGDQPREIVRSYLNLWEEVRGKTEVSAWMLGNLAMWFYALERWWSRWCCMFGFNVPLASLTRRRFAVDSGVSGGTVLGKSKISLFADIRRVCESVRRKHSGPLPDVPVAVL